MRVAVAQPLVRPGEVEHNRRAMAEHVACAASQGARLILFSETGLTGFDLSGIAIRAALSRDDSTLRKIDEMASKYRIAIVQGFYERCGDRLFNTAGVFIPGGERLFHRKSDVSPCEAAGGVSVADFRPEIFAVDEHRFSILICDEVLIDGIDDELLNAECTALLCPTAGMGNSRKGFVSPDLVDPAAQKKYVNCLESTCFPRGSIERALRMGMATVACNQAGWVPELQYFHPGHSSIVDGSGRMTALIPGEFRMDALRPQTAVGELSLVRASRPQTG